MITSTSNAQIKELAKLQKKSRLRDEKGIFLVEGPRMTEEIPAERIEKVYASESFAKKNKEFLKKIEEVCTKIHESKRVILVGALYPMSIAVEFQTDLISFGKTVLQYHTYDKDMIFNENDYVIFTSSSGRSLEGFMYTRTNLSLQNTTS